MKKQKICMYIEILLAIFLVLLLVRISMVETAQTMSTNQGGKLAIVIDDFGNNSDGTEEMLALPIAFTGAVMPEMPYTKQEQEKLLSSGKGVILHQPMEAHTGKRSWLGATPILAEMTPQEAVKVFEGNLQSVDKARGFNNHMGSKITEDRAKMQAILQTAKDKKLYFLDSLTTGKSVAYDVAKEIGVPYIKRDVFLDSTQNLNTIENNILKAAKIARENGRAVAIGHVGAEGGKVTARALQNLYKQIENSGIEFVKLENIIQ